MILEKKVQLERMTTTEVKAAVAESNGIVILPVGAIEVHGPHLPVGTDSIETIEIARRAAVEVGAVLAPPIWYGNSRGFMDFPGTVTLEPETLRAVIKDVLMSLIKHGFNKPVILDGHGGNYGMSIIAAEDLHLQTGTLVSHVRAWDMATLSKPKELPTYDGHGGYSETSVMLYLCPEDVDKAQYVDSAPEVEITKYAGAFPSPSSLYGKGAVTLPLMMGQMVKIGHHGDPHLATAEQGKGLIEVKTAAVVEYLQALKANQIKLRK